MTPARKANDDKELAQRRHEQTVADYVAVRSEWTGFRNTSMVLFSVSIAVHGAIITVLTNIGELAYGRVIAAAAPLVSWLVLGQYVQFSIEATVRGFYGRAVERSLMAGYPGELALTITGRDLAGVSDRKSTDRFRMPAPLWFHLTHPLGSPKRQMRSLQLQTMLGIVVLGVLTIGETVLFLLATRNLALGIAAGCLYGFFAVVDLRVLSMSLHGERLWAYLVAQLDQGLHRTLEPDEMISVVRDSQGMPMLHPRWKGWPILGFVLIPRPFEFLHKAMLVFTGSLGFVMLAEQSGMPLSGLGFVLGSFFAFEVALYQGRYLLNDINGRDTDEKDLLRVGSRIPASVSTRAAWWIVGIHMIGGVGLLAALSARRGSWVTGQLVAVGIVLGCAVIYEWLRIRVDRGQVQLPKLVTALLAAVTGAGYGARGIFGLATGYTVVGSQPPGGAMELGAAYMSAIGVTGVLAGWMSSASGFAARANTKRRKTPVPMRLYVATMSALLSDEQRDDPDATILAQRGRPRMLLGFGCAVAGVLAAGCGQAMAHQAGTDRWLVCVTLGALAGVTVGKAWGWVRGAAALALAWVLMGWVTGSIGSVVPLLVTFMPFTTFVLLQTMSGKFMHDLGHRFDWARR